MYKMIKTFLFVNNDINLHYMSAFLFLANIRSSLYFYLINIAQCRTLDR